MHRSKWTAAVMQGTVTLPRSGTENLQETMRLLSNDTVVIPEVMVPAAAGRLSEPGNTPCCHQ
ncbi:hypothetical protein [Chitinophaga nivalis]|uniref:Uncharacterized protein n=1 Tax=Chitinophaga nivalis TaxID=2991709 RepID=A0ABT3IJW3_9BACT|nr:hypothetical protein [Chitinophaga nivalis]MCW3466053.1 hypothetical protein [Chitinophaga nivalis]MCW3484256.1 hypothetical protein [Chitinophaga nivalis]